MKTKTPRGIWALRAVTATITLIVLLVIGTVVYSAYEDYTAVRSELAGGSSQATGRAVLQGSSELISINITVPNSGLYPLNVTVTCTQKNPNIVCQPSRVNVPAGQQGVLHFHMTIVNLAQFAAASDHRIDGTVAIALVPFASLSIGFDLGGFVKTGVP